MTAKTIDYDAFRSEQAPATAEPVYFKIGGKQYPLLPQLPAVVVLDAIRLNEDAGTDADKIDVSAVAIDGMGRAMFGEENWRAILVEHRLGIDEIPQLIKAALGAYIEDPKVLALISQMELPASQSLKTGRGSRRTSRASTKSTSSKRSRR